MFRDGTFKDGLGFAAECVSGISCTQVVSVEVAYIVFEMVGVRWDCSVAFCAEQEEAHCIECLVMRDERGGETEVSLEGVTHYFKIRPRSPSGR